MDKFDKKLTNKILLKFNNAKEWSDLIQILKNLKENLVKYSSSNMGNLTDKITLAKRLAQCLNPNLPAGVHETCLDVYSMLYDNIKKNNNNILGEDLGLYSSGLFPFFAYASIQNKIKFFNEIIKKHYLTLEEKEFNLCLPGMIASILPALDEQNETMQKNLKEIFKESRNKVGESKFFGYLWDIIFRNNKLRLPCIKYINEIIPIYKEIENDDEAIEEIKKNHYPNYSILVLNSLKVLIEDSELIPQRIAMDFIISHFPINNKIFNEDEKINLLISGLKLLIKNDYSTTRRLLIWLMGPGQEDDLEVEDLNVKYMIQLLIKSLNKIFDFSNKNILKYQDDLINGIKITDQLFKQQVRLVDYILEPISINIINAIENYWEKSNQSPKDEIILKIKNFYSYDPGYLDCLWSSLGKKLSIIVSNYKNSDINNNINNNYDNEENDNLENNVLNDLDSIIRVLNFCLLYVQLEKRDKKIKFYIPIISSLLRSLQIYSIQSTDDFSNIRPIIMLSLKLTKSLQLGINSEDVPFIEKTTNLIVREIKFSSTQGNSLQYILKQNKQNVELIDFFSENILLYQQTYITICKVMLEEEEISRDDIKIFKHATELSLIIQEYINNKSTDIPEWIFYLEKIIFSTNIDLSLSGIYYLLDLFIVTSENIIYDNIKAYLRTDEISEELIDKDLLKDIIYQTHVNSNCIELSMAKLWLLIEEQNHQKPVVDLLIKFFMIEQNVFQNTISNTFTINDIEQNVNAIKKFTQFWKLTSEFYPKTIFFENGECIFKMLDYLDHEHPLLRHLSKSWLSEAKDQFSKIIDPLLKVLLDRDTKWYISFQKQLYFTKEYDNRRIIEAFRKLKNIIINVPEVAVNHFVNKLVTKDLIYMDDFGRELKSVTRSISIEHYLELLVSISLRFIQGKFIESISQSFYRENFSVNAASCEFLEFLLSFIEPKSRVMNIAKLIVDPVLNILHESLLTNDEVMQVQLINLLKVLLLSTKDEHLNFKEDTVSIFNNSKFLNCIVSGIQINYIFVRGYFINFVESCLPIFSNILDKNSNLKIAKRLINTTTDFLVSRIKYNIIPTTENKLNSMQLKEDDKYFIVKNYIEQYKDFKQLDENDVNVIIKGLKNILFHFLNITNPDLSPYKINWLECKKEIFNQSTSNFSIFGFFGSSGKNNDSKNKENLEQNQEIGIQIIDILQDVIASFCTVWINDSGMKNSKDFCLNEFGMLANSFEEFSFSEYQKKNNSLLFRQNEQLKDSIIIILRNIFIKYPIEFMKNFIDLFKNENNKYIAQDKQYKLTMIEILEKLDIPIEIFLLVINKNIDINKIKDIKRSKTRVKDIYPYYLNKSQCIYEAKICHLVYAFLNYNNSNTKFESKILVEMWNELITFINMMIESKSPMTLYWLYEIINLVLYKLPVNEITTDSSIKKKLKVIIVNLFNKLLDLCICNKYDSIFEESCQIITPLPPSVYEKVAIEIYGKDISKIETKTKRKVKIISEKKINVNENIILENKINEETDKKEEESKKIEIQKVSSIKNDTDYLLNYYNLLHDYVENGTLIKNEDLIIAYRNIGFITLSSLFYTTMKNIFRQDKMSPYFQILVKNLFSIMNERNIINKIYIDLSTEFLHSLITNAASITCASCRQMIIDFFLESDFFNMSLKNLRLWKNIISEFSRSYTNLVSDLTDKMTQGTGLFSKNNEQFIIIAMRRLSFIIYSCPKDTFSSKLMIIMEKIKEMITRFNENPNLECEIFLMLRIMFLRFSRENLIEMVSALWPIIFAEIVNITNNKRKNPSLELDNSGYKLIELLSVANMDEFCLYQWIFFLDTYKIEDLDINEENSELNKLLHSNERAFKPFAMGMAKHWDECKELIEKYKEKKFEEFEKRTLMIHAQKLVSQDQLASLIARIFIYVGIMNNFRNVIDLDIIEEVIEKDFLITY